MAKSTRSQTDGLTARPKRPAAKMLPQSLPYHHLMRRFMVLLALVFAFASLAGMTTAHAHRYVSTPIVVLNHVDEANRSIPVIVAVQRGQIDLGSGILMPCGAHHGIPVTVAPLPVRPAGTTARTIVPARMAEWSTTRLLRPPIAA